MNGCDEQTVRCNNGQVIQTGSPNLARENRQPCPICGSLSRVLAATINETIDVSSHIPCFRSDKARP